MSGLNPVQCLEFEDFLVFDLLGVDATRFIVATRHQLPVGRVRVDIPCHLPLLLGYPQVFLNLQQKVD